MAYHRPKGASRAHPRPELTQPVPIFDPDAVTPETTGLSASARRAALNQPTLDMYAEEAYTLIKFEKDNRQPCSLSTIKSARSMSLARSG